MKIYTNKHNKNKIILSEVNNLDDMELFLREKQAIFKPFNKITDKFKSYFLNLIKFNDEISLSSLIDPIVSLYANKRLYNEDPREWLLLRGFEGMELERMIVEIKEKFKTTCWKKEKWIEKGLSEEEAIRKVKELQTNNANKFKLKRNKNPKLYEDYLPTQLKYWINRGYSEEEAFLKLKERQNTGSIEKYIERFGNVNGPIRWKERQEKWQKTLNSKSLEEIRRINRSKFSNLNYSKISQKLFWMIFEKLKGRKFNHQILFATINEKQQIDETKNNEYIVELKSQKHFRYLDFYIPDLNIAIEFDGFLFHKNVILDNERENEIKEAIPGIEFLRIIEKDYLKNPIKVVNECVNFILDHNKPMLI